MLGTIKVIRSGTDVTLKTDAVAWGTEFVYLLSVAGPEASIKAFAACLVLDQPTRFTFDGVKETNTTWGRSPGYGAMPYKGGYKIKKAKIAPHTWQAVAIADCPGLMACVSDEAIWQTLRDPRFTTPVLRSWVPWIKEQVTANRQLLPLRCFQCKVGLLDIDTATLDGLVSRGLKSRALEIK